MSVTTSINLPPATTGTFNYNAQPNIGATLAVGATYEDPVFSTTVLRLTSIGTSTQNDDEIYAYHYLNCDGTYSFHNRGGMRILNASTGATVASSQPVGSIGVFEIRWDMVSSDVYWMRGGTHLVKRSVSSQVNTTVHTFPATLQAMGGTANYQTADGRLHLVMYSNGARIWDSVNNSTSINTVSMMNWIGISPSGNNVYTAAGGSASPNNEHYAYGVNRSALTISTTPKQIFGWDGDHGGLISASNGKDYVITYLGDLSPNGIFAMSLDVDRSGLSLAQQITTTGAIRFNNVTSSANQIHVSPVSVGTLTDWCFVSMEATDDDFDDPVGAWRPYKSENVAVNPITSTTARLMHHRSRGPFNGAAEYYRQPRISSSGDGSKCAWASDMNISTVAGYADLYLGLNPLGDEPPPETSSAFIWAGSASLR